MCGCVAYRKRTFFIQLRLGYVRESSHSERSDQGWGIYQRLWWNESRSDKQGCNSRLACDFAGGEGRSRKSDKDAETKLSLKYRSIQCRMIAGPSDSMCIRQRAHAWNVSKNRGVSSDS